MNVFVFLRRQVFSIPPSATRFESRGFVGGTPEAQARIEQIGSTFASGYHAALEAPRSAPLEQRLEAVDSERRGFAYEGAAMALVLLDFLTPWQGGRFRRFLSGAGDAHAYMLHVGAGWALARLPRRVEVNLRRFDPLLRWLILDGYGFHQGYFHWPRFIARQKEPRGLSAYGRRAFDQGLGRSLWFVKGADISLIADTVQSFEQRRRSDLWAGVGLAAGYAGGVTEKDLHTLSARSGDYCPQLAQGAAFAAKARQRAGNPAHHTELACHILCGLDPVSASSLTDTTLKDLPPDAAEPAYEVWRQRIVRQLSDNCRENPQ